MVDVIEKRLTDLETLVWDIPNLLNARFTRFDTEFVSLRGALTDMTTRVAALERAMTGLQTDMRDLRGGVTRQLIEQDKRLADQEKRLGAIENKIGTLDDKLAKQGAHLGKIEQKIDEVLKRLPMA